MTGLLSRRPRPDPFTEAEVLLPLAYLHMHGGALDTAEQELDRYGQLYADLAQGAGSRSFAAAAARYGTCHAIPRPWPRPSR